MKRLVSLWIVLFLFIPFQVSAQEATSFVALDGTTGQIIEAANEQSPEGVGEVVQLMTIYVLEKKKEEGIWKEEDIVYISPRVAQIAKLFASTERVPKRWVAGNAYKASELYTLLLVEQSKEAAIALAEHVASSERQFLQWMEEEAKALQLDYTRFVNVSGVSNEVLQSFRPEGTGATEENMMTALSVATLTYDLLQRYPHITEETKRPTAVVERKGKVPLYSTNPNPYIEESPEKDALRGVEGLRVGTSDFSGESAVITAKKGRYRFITVVLHAQDDEERHHVIRRWITNDFQNVTAFEIVSKGESLDHIQWHSIEHTPQQVAVYAKEPLYGLTLETSYKLKWKPIKQKDWTGSLQKGTVVGTVELIRADGTPLHYVDDATPIEVEVALAESVEPATLWQKGQRLVKMYTYLLWRSATQLFS